ncbi:MAG: alanine racemase [Clostridia bacterium]|nr:alanine racemase [Clostridia bacterium]
MKNFWCEVDLQKISNNINKIRSGTSKKIMAVLKGNAYGLGIERVSEFLTPRVDCFAVTYFDEAHMVQSSKDILIMTPDYTDEDLRNSKKNFVLTIDDLGGAEKLTKSNQQFRAHLYINTGMNRFGIHPDRLDAFMESMEKYQGKIKIEGFYTHLHNTNNKKFTLSQIELFSSCVGGLSHRAYNFHLLNSNGFVKFNKQCSFDNMIRVGGILYGFDGLKQGYQKTYQFKASPINVYQVEKGKNIGYGSFYKTPRDITVGILDFGYIDKFYCPETIFDNKFLSLMGRVYYRYQYRKSITYHGKPVKILGSVNMNYTLVDMEDLPEDSVFDVDISPLAADSSVQKKYI